MKLKDIIYDVAVQFEMAVTSRLERRYRSEKSRKDDIIGDYKDICRKNMAYLDSNVERAKLYGRMSLLYYSLITSLTDEEFYEYVRELINEMKSYGENTPRHNAFSNNMHTRTDRIVYPDHTIAANQYENNMDTTAVDIKGTITEKMDTTAVGIKGSITEKMDTTAISRISGRKVSTGMIPYRD